MITGKTLGQQIISVIEANPHLHDQQYYNHESHCGTTYCIAGWAIYLNAKGGESWQQAKRRLATELNVPIEADSDYPEHEYIDPDLVAQKLLGMEAVNAFQVFWMMNNQTALERFRSLMAE